MNVRELILHVFLGEGVPRETAETYADTVELILPAFDLKGLPRAQVIAVIAALVAGVLSAHFRASGMDWAGQEDVELGWKVAHTLRAKEKK